MLLLSLLFACFECDYPIAPAVDPHCVDQPESISMEDEIEGVSLKSLLPIESRGQVQFEYEEEARCANWLLAIDTASATYVNAGVVEDANEHAHNLSCSDYMTVQATLSLVSHDGLFNEELPISLYYSFSEDRGTRLSFYQELPVDALQGDIDPNDFYSAESSSAERLTLDGSIDADAFRAAIYVYAEDVDTANASLQNLVSFEQSCE